jgi:hypothetical protein
VSRLISTVAIVFFSEGNKRVKAHLRFLRNPIIQRRRRQSQARQNQDKRIFGARELHVYRSNNATGTTASATGYKLVYNKNNCKIGGIRRTVLSDETIQKEEHSAIYYGKSLYFPYQIPQAE